MTQEYRNANAVDLIQPTRRRHAPSSICRRIILPRRKATRYTLEQRIVHDVQAVVLRVGRPPGVARRAA